MTDHWIRYDVLDAPTPVGVYRTKRGVKSAVAAMGGKVLCDDADMTVARIAGKKLVMFVKKDVSLDRAYVKIIGKFMEES